MNSHEDKNKLIRFSKKVFVKLMGLFFLLVKPLERIFSRKYTKEPLKHQPVFIIGAPRTGSTILYQIISNQFDVLYFDNLVCRMHQIPFIGFWFSEKVFRHRPHNCFRSFFGATLAFGLRAPSECGAFWYRWLPKERHFVDYKDFNDKTVSQIRNELTAIINHFDRPLLIKNLNAGQRLRLLKKCFPEAKLIYVRRDPLMVAQSILEAKREIGLRDCDFWSVRPFNFVELLNLDGFEQVVKQIYYLEKQIEKDLGLFDSRNVLRLDYKNLTTKNEEIIDLCMDFIGSKLREGYSLPCINYSDSIRLEKREIEKLAFEIGKLDWSNCEK